MFKETQKIESTQPEKNQYMGKVGTSAQLHSDTQGPLERREYFFLKPANYLQRVDEVMKCSLPEQQMCY